MSVGKSREPVERLAFSPAEAAQAIGKSESFVRELIHRGKLQATVIDNGVSGKQRRTTLLISRAALNALIEGRRV